MDDCVLEGAAVAGDPFEPELAAAAAETSEASAMEAIDELLELDLVRETDVPRRFRFRHPLVRRAVYEATPGGWRLGAHERCAEALAARGATAAARAHHVERSAREGDLDAVAVLREAGEGAVRLAPASAARWFADALRLLPQTAPAHERVELLLARAGALTAAGHFARQPQRAAGGPRDRARRRHTRCAPGSPGPVPASRASSDGTSTPASRLASALEGLPDYGVSRGRGAHDRARHEQALAHEVRGDAGVGRARGELRRGCSETRP